MKKLHERGLIDIKSGFTRDLSNEFVQDVLALPWEGFGGSYAKEQLLSKFCDPSPESAQIRQARAIEKWLQTETRNRKTNARLLLDETSFTYRVSPGVCARFTSDEVLARAADVITQILGPFSGAQGSFSGGASTSKSRRHSTMDEKFAGKAHVTADALPAWIWELFQNPMLARLPDGCETITYDIIDGNVLFCVPKNAEIDRVACKEPDLNLYLQKGVGDFIRHRLRRVGIDLNDQSRNGELARQGSITGSLATLDLSAASDSVTTQLCARLFEPAWFDTLMRLRSPKTKVNGEWHENEMLSSMGNGFTFEVESLIFYALARATAWLTRTKGVISVYGDDLIVPTRMALIFGQVLGFCGFLLNMKKSYWTGSFRESCGAHWHNGTCVKPVYIRRPVLSLCDLILHLNALKAWWSTSGITDPRILPFWRKWSDRVPPKFWGGTEVTPYALMRVGGGSMRLVAQTKTRKRNDLGSYVYWMHARTVMRSEDAQLLLASETGLYRARKGSRATVPFVFYEDDRPGGNFT